MAQNQDNVEQYISDLNKRTGNNPTGMYDPAEFVNNMNEQRYFGRLGEGDSLMSYFDKLQPATKKYLNELIQTEMNDAKANGRRLNKYDLRYIEHMVKAKFGNVDPAAKSLDISTGNMTDKYLAEQLNNYTYSKNTDVPKPAAAESKPTETKKPKPDTSTWQSRIKNAKASEADLKKAYEEYKAGRYKPGPKTMAYFKEHFMQDTMKKTNMDYLTKYKDYLKVKNENENEKPKDKKDIVKNIDWSKKDWKVN